MLKTSVLKPAGMKQITSTLLIDQKASDDRVRSASNWNIAG